MEAIFKILQIIRNDLLIFFKKFKLPDVFKVKVVEMPEKQIKVDVNVPKLDESKIKIELDEKKFIVPKPEVKVEIPKIEIPKPEVKPEISVNVDLKRIEKIFNDLAEKIEKNNKEINVKVPTLSQLIKVEKEIKEVIKECFNELFEKMSKERKLPEKFKVQLLTADESEVWDFKDIKVPVAFSTSSGFSPSSDYWRDYYPSDEAKDGDYEYYGFVNKNGNWYIQRKYQGTWRYAWGDSNYQENWNNRENLDYKYLFEIMK